MVASGSTPVHGIPWPDGDEPADGSQHMKNIADAVERELVEHDTAIAAGMPDQYVKDTGDTMTGHLQFSAGTKGIYWPTANKFLWAPTTAMPGGAANDMVVSLGSTGAATPLVVGAPALIGQAARWADGVPRFASTTARDAAYTSIGGAQAGMRCYVGGTTHQHYFHDGTSWKWQATDGGTAVEFRLTADVTTVAGFQAIKWIAPTIPPYCGLTYSASTGAVTMPAGTTWSGNMLMTLSVAGTALTSWRYAFSTASTGLSHIGHSIHVATGGMPIGSYQAGSYTGLFSGTRYVTVYVNVAGSKIVASSTALYLHRSA